MIGATYPIPEAALDDRFAFVGTSGSGKTYAASTAVERLLDRAARVIIVDPLDVWWGLRLAPNGTDPGRPVIIFGGSHGDLPLTENAGGIIGETVSGMAESCIVSLSGLGTKAAERRFMLAFLEEIYRRASGEPVHLIFDEADLWAPQNASEPMLLNKMEQIVRRGRVKGLIPWLITQRPAVVSKDVLSQADGLVMMKLTGPHDRKAVGSWIEGQADRDEGKRILGELATFKQGEGVVWLPARDVLLRAKFPAKGTYDSSRTPKRGEKRVDRQLEPLNIDALRANLATVEQVVKENDPAALKAEIARLRAALAEQPAPNDQAIRAAREIAYCKGREDGLTERSVDLITVRTLLDDLIGKAGLNPFREEAASSAMPAKRSGSPAQTPPRQGPGERAHSAHDISRKDAAAAGAASTLIGPERRPLTALVASHPYGMTETSWAVAAGMKRTSGTWSSYKSRLRTAGLIQQTGKLFFATEAAVGAIGDDVERVPAPGKERVEYWATKVSAAAPMLRAIASAHPAWLSRKALGERLSMSPSSGTFSAYLSRLRSPGLIEVDRERGVRAASSLMGAQF